MAEWEFEIVFTKLSEAVENEKQNYATPEEYDILTTESENIAEMRRMIVESLDFEPCTYATV